MGNLTKLSIDNEHIRIESDVKNVRKIEEIVGCVSCDDTSIVLRANSPTAFALRFFLRGLSIEADKTTLETLKNLADKVPTPIARISARGNNLEIRVPYVKFYRDIMGRIGAWTVSNGLYRINISKLLSVETVNVALKDYGLPEIAFDEDVKKLRTDPIEGFDGSLDSLRDIPIDALHTVKVFAQTSQKSQRSKKTFTEKLEDFGLRTLYDLAMDRPYRYINKSEPDAVYDLNDKEPVTVIGKISGIRAMRDNKGVVFTLDLGGYSIDTQFFRQAWLQNRFREGNEVVVTGKINFYQGKKQITGNSIEDSREAVALPIVPVYKQSESRGITTTTILSMVRELLSRVGEIDLPPYLPKNNMSLTDAISSVHFPETFAEFYSARDYLAFIELTLLQFYVQRQIMDEVNKPGISMKNDSLLKQALENLPFTLTGAQERGLETISGAMSSESPSSILLTAEVGAGKSLEAQLACLLAVGSGYQAAVSAPVETLAIQLYQSFLKLFKNMPFEINVQYLSPSMKKREKDSVLKGLADGTVDIVIGTHVLLKKSSVKYANLGFVVIDEQQKFGVEQRSDVLSSREDGKVPDLMMMTATPVPRSLAQTIFGDIDLVVLDEKPPGRLPIETKWVRRRPQEVLNELTNDVYTDIITEAEKGNKTFVFAPLVEESFAVDASSVKMLYEVLSKGPLSGLNIGMIHGKMKQADQQEVMRAFRDGDINVLVASTVVEVGIDVPEATRVVIFSADRLGASSLHQIRGRVGRNDLPSKCYLISDPVNEKSIKRLQAVADFSDGFELATADMEDRGEGNVLGTAQKGKSSMVFATLATHQKMIPDAIKHAQKILKSPYSLAAVRAAKRRFDLEENSQRLI